MNKRIIYPTTDGGVAVIIPATEWFAKEGNTIKSLAEKDVPSGVAYKIVDVSEIPEDRTFRAAWEADFSNPDGYGLGYDAWLQQQPVKPEVISNDND